MIETKNSVYKKKKKKKKRNQIYIMFGWTISFILPQELQKINYANFPYFFVKKHARSFNRKFFLELKKVGADQPQ
jgi:hypothetical protein